MNHKIHISLREDTFEKLNKLKNHYDKLYEFAGQKFSYTNIISLCIHNEYGALKNYEDIKKKGE